MSQLSQKHINELPLQIARHVKIHLGTVVTNDFMLRTGDAKIQRVVPEDVDS